MIERSWDFEMTRWGSRKAGLAIVVGVSLLVACSTKPETKRSRNVVEAPGAQPLSGKKPVEAASRSLARVVQVLKRLHLQLDTMLPEDDRGSAEAEVKRLLVKRFIRAARAGGWSDQSLRSVEDVRFTDEAGPSGAGVEQGVLEVSLNLRREAVLKVCREIFAPFLAQDFISSKLDLVDCASMVGQLAWVGEVAASDIDPCPRESRELVAGFLFFAIRVSQALEAHELQLLAADAFLSTESHGSASDLRVEALLIRGRAFAALGLFRSAIADVDDAIDSSYSLSSEWQIASRILRSEVLLRAQRYQECLLEVRRARALVDVPMEMEDRKKAWLEVLNGREAQCSFSVLVEREGAQRAAELGRQKISTNEWSGEGVDAIDLQCRILMGEYEAAIASLDEGDSVETLGTLFLLGPYWLLESGDIDGAIDCVLSLERYLEAARARDAGRDARLLEWVWMLGAQCYRRKYWNSKDLDDLKAWLTYERSLKKHQLDWRLGTTDTELHLRSNRKLRSQVPFDVVDALMLLSDRAASPQSANRLQLEALSFSEHIRGLTLEAGYLSRLALNNEEALSLLSSCRVLSAARARSTSQDYRVFVEKELRGIRLKLKAALPEIAWRFETEIKLNARPGEKILFSHCSPKRAYFWMADDRGWRFSHSRLISAKEVRKRVRDSRDLLDKQGGRPESLVEESKALGRLMLPPREAFSEGQWVFILDGPFADFPASVVNLESLLGDEPRFIVVAEAPSLGVHFYARRRIGPLQERSALLAVNSLGDQTQGLRSWEREDYGVLRTQKSLSKLVGASNVRFLGEVESSGIGVSDLQDSLRGAEIVHIATHGVASDVSLDSWLLVNKNRRHYKLRARELASWSMERLRLVVLSSCNGLRRSSESGEPLGLTRPFLLNGVGTVIASDRGLRLEQGSVFARIYDELAGGRSVRVAVQAAVSAELAGAEPAERLSLARAVSALRYLGALN